MPWYLPAALPGALCQAQKEHLYMAEYKNSWAQGWTYKAL